MWTVLVIVGFIALVIFLVVGAISAIRKNGKAKRHFSTAGVGFLLLVVGAFNVGDAEQTAATLPEYKIVEERIKHDGAHKYLRVSTDATSESELRAIAKDLKEKNEKAEAVWLWIHAVNDNPNGYGDLKASVRFGNGALGKMFAAEANSVDGYAFEMGNKGANGEDMEQTNISNETVAQSTQDSEIVRYKEYATKLRGSSFLKTAEVKGDSGYIEILADYAEYKKIKPEATISEKDFVEYWNTGDAINKTLMEEPVRLLREFPDLRSIHFDVVSVGKTFTVELDRETAEQYFKVNLKDLHEDKSLDKWREQISAKYFTPEERAKYVEQFVKVK